MRLRGHHLLCMLTYKGEGYSPAFIANFDKIVDRIQAGESIEIANGADDICSCLLVENPGAHCLNESVSVRDALALRQIREAGIELGESFTLSPAQLAALRAAFAQNSIRAACEACEWQGLCTQIARDGFKDVRLKL